MASTLQPWAFDCYADGPVCPEVLASYSLLLTSSEMSWTVISSVMVRTVSMASSFLGHAVVPWRRLGGACNPGAGCGPFP